MVNDATEPHIKYVLDASVIIAYLRGEPGGNLAHLLSDAAISTVNWAEVVQKLQGTALNHSQAHWYLQRLGVRFVPFTTEQATTAGNLISATRRFGLGLGDRACLALGIELTAEVLTLDRVWTQLSVGVEVRAMR